MPTNKFFNTAYSDNEQRLLDSLVAESIRIYGQDMAYLPRRLDAPDHITGTSDQNSFVSAHWIEAYVEDVSGFGGDKDFMSKFNLEIRDQVVLAVSRLAWDELVRRPYGIERPAEGDLLYWPKNGKCFEIKYADNKEAFYPLGTLPMFQLTCELFEYSDEHFDTGVPEIDQLMESVMSTDALQWAIEDQTGRRIVDEHFNNIVVPGFDLELFDPSADNDHVQREADAFIDFSVTNPFGEDE